MIPTELRQTVFLGHHGYPQGPTFSVALFVVSHKKGSNAFGCGFREAEVEKVASYINLSMITLPESLTPRPGMVLQI